MKALKKQPISHKSSVSSRRVADDAIERSKISASRTWAELTANDDAHTRYPLPQRAKESPEEMYRE
jgi:hypothetical protein